MTPRARPTSRARTPPNFRDVGADPLDYDGPTARGEEVQIRRAVIDDVAGIAALYVASWQAAYPGLLPQAVLDGLRPEQWWTRWTTTIRGAAWPSRGTLVAADGHNELAGFVDLRPAVDDEQDRRVGEIASVHVHPSCWSEGVGQQLMAASVEALTDAGFTTAALWVLDGNTRAMRFYTRSGWTFDGTTQADNVGGTTIYDRRMRRTLTPG